MAFWGNVDNSMLKGYWSSLKCRLLFLILIRTFVSLPLKNIVICVQVHAEQICTKSSVNILCKYGAVLFIGI